MTRAGTLLLTCTLLLVGITLAPAAVPVASACQGELHTVQFVCGHETAREYTACYLTNNGPLRWGNCL